MIKLLIVDDEAKTRNGLLNHIDWVDIGIDIIQSAASGAEAIALCQDFLPDIILSDIRMRGMSGIELCEEIRKLNPNCKIIFISGYSDKEYLKAAIHLNAVDYVEKPVRPSSLKEIVRKTVADVREEQLTLNLDHEKYISQVRRNVLLSLTCPSSVAVPVSASETNAVLKKAYSLYRVCILHTAAPVLNLRRFMDSFPCLDESQPRSDRLCVYSCFKDNRNIILLLSGDQNALALQGAYLSALSLAVTHYSKDNQRLFLAYGSLANTRQEIPDSYANALFAMQSVIYRGYQSCADCSEGFPRAIIPFDSALFGEFQTALHQHDFSGLQRVLKKTYDYLCLTHPMNIGFVQHIYYSFYQEILYESGQINPLSEHTAPSNEIGSLDTLQEMNDYLSAQLADIFRNAEQKRVSHASLHAVISCIQNSYSDPDLSVRKLAANVYLTPTYLSTLFKQQLGLTISEYLTDVRIRHAKSLIRGTQYPLSQVAQMVGYEDANYFARIFKKTTGITPTEYRDGCNT